MVCAATGHPLVVVMAESFSVERRRLMRFLGARVILTPAALRATGMVQKTVELAERHGWFYARQFENPANPDMHERTTAREIIADFRGEQLDYFVIGYGTGGTLNGVSRVLARESPSTKVIVCEPSDAQLLGSGAPQARNPDGSASAGHPAWRPHPMQGWTPDFIPKITGDVDLKRVHRILPVPAPTRCGPAASWRRARASSWASPPVPPSPARSPWRGRHRRGPTSSASCPTPASGTSPRRSSPRSRPT